MTTTSLVTNTVVTNGDSTFDALPQQQQRPRITGGTVALADDLLRQAGLMRRRDVPTPPPCSSFAGFRFPPEVLMVAVRWYLRYALSYRDVEELLVETRYPG
jgi:hypothetical protein